MSAPSVRPSGRLRRTATRAWASDRLLALLVALMGPTLAVCAIGLAVDPNVITGAPAWLKPAKFSVSIAIYGATLLWLLTLIGGHRRLVRTIGAVTARPWHRAGHHRGGGRARHDQPLQRLDARADGRVVDDGRLDRPGVGDEPPGDDPAAAPAPGQPRPRLEPAARAGGLVRGHGSGVPHDHPHHRAARRRRGWARDPRRGRPQRRRGRRRAGPADRRLEHGRG